MRLVVELKSEQYLRCILDESQKEVSEDEFLALPFNLSELEEMGTSGPARLQLLQWDVASAVVGCLSARSSAVILAVSVSTLEFSCCFHDTIQPYGFMMFL